MSAGHVQDDRNRCQFIDSLYCLCYDSISLSEEPILRLGGTMRYGKKSANPAGLDQERISRWIVKNGIKIRPRELVIISTGPHLLPGA